MQQSLASRLLLHPGDGSHCILAIMSASADSMLISSTCVCVCVFVALYLTSRSPRVQPEFSTLPSPPTPLNVWWGRWKEGKGRGGSCLESPQKPLMASQSYDSEKRQLVLVWVRVPVFPSCLSTCVSVLRDRCPAGPMTLRFVDFFSLFFHFFFCPWTSALLSAVTLHFRLYFLPYHRWGMCCCLTIPYYFYICCSRTAAATEAGISCSRSSVLCWFYLATWWILRGEDKV